MKPRQCKGCPDYIPEIFACIRQACTFEHVNNDGTKEERRYYVKISKIPRCNNANNGHGGVDNASDR